MDNNRQRLGWPALAVLHAACLAGPVLAGQPARAVVIALDDAGRPTVTRLHAPDVDLGPDRQGLVVWEESGKERWQRVTSRWQMPRRQAHAGGPTRGGLSRRPADTPAQTGELVALTAQLEELRGEALLRGGGLLTPPDRGVLLDPRPTVRRKAARAGSRLPAALAVITRDGTEVARLPLAESQLGVRWVDVAGLPQKGLEPGSYTLRLRPGADLVTFRVADPGLRDRVLRLPAELERALGSRADPLYLEATAEHLLAQVDELGRPRPYLADALDVLEAAPEKALTPHLRRLREHILQWLEDPGQQPLPPATLGPPTHLEPIDLVRGLIAAGQWARALKVVESIRADASLAGRRLRGLAELYRGVIYAESSPEEEEEAVTAFRKAIQELKGGLAADLYRAHNDIADFLLGRAQDRLHNHAFQMAAGARHPFLDLLLGWELARQHYEAALTLADKLGPSERAAVRVNLARLYALLADVIRTLDGPAADGQRFRAGEQASARMAGQLAREAGREADASEKEEPLTRAVVAELQAHLAFRAGQPAACRQHAERALDDYLRAGSLAGLEGGHRLLGLVHRRAAAGQASAAARDREQRAALRHFLIAHCLTEVLREHFPPGRFGLTRAGFFTRRAYVYEQLVELLISQGKAAEALRFAELARARALQDLLAERQVGPAPPQTQEPDLTRLLARWPGDVAAVEYFLGTERAWVFLVDAAGGVQVFPLRQGGRGEPVPPRALIARVRRFLDDLGHQAARMSRRLTAGQGYDHSWQDTLHDFCRELMPGPVLAELRRARTVIVVPHHILHYFPFAALVTEPDALRRDPFQMVQPRFLVDEPFDLCQAPSLTSWDLLRRQPGRPLDQVNALGIVDFPGAPSLPGVADEIDHLKKAFGRKVGTVHFAEAASKANLEALLRRPGLLLIATHGLNLPDRPLDSFLLLFGRDQGMGRLTAAEIYDARVASDLVVLSACYSGLADRSPLPGDDLFGLQRAFLQAGARTVLAGLWDVYDATGPQLTDGVFRRLAQGQSAPAALAGSQRDFLRRLRASKEPEPFLHPYFWAVYAVTGDDRSGSRKAQP